MAVTASVFVLASCASGGHAPTPSTSFAPPATNPGGTPVLVGGPAARYVRVEVSAGSRQAQVPAALAANLVPLLIARDVGLPSDLSPFGLDHPRATITFTETTGATTVVTLGQPNFDNHGVYAIRAPMSRVWLVLASGVRPVLALVGVVVPPPTD